MTTAVPSASMGAGAVAGCMGGVATHKMMGERMAVTEGPVDVRTVALDAEAAGGWMVVPRGYDKLAANPIAGAKEGAVGIPPVVGSRGCWCTCSWLYMSCAMGL